jgi:undecaprenyl diphosphate synthase
MPKLRQNLHVPEERARMDPKLAALVAKAARWPTLAAPAPPELLPKHVAIIMDGNGRWATRQGLIRINGHQVGVDAVRRVTRYCGQVKIKALTLFAFSTENWKRPKTEINFLFRLLKRYLISERAELIANNVRLTSIGNIAALPESVTSQLRLTQQLTARNTGLNLCLALNYGAHDELLSAARTLAVRVAEKSMTPDEIDSGLMGGALFTAGMPPLDLLIRTAGERRLSNFLLWQACEAEFAVTSVCWPDFREQDLEQAIVAFSRRAKLHCVRLETHAFETP